MRTRTSSGETSQWSMEDKKKLLNAIVEMGGSSNTKSYKAVESSLKWENFKLDGKSAEDCKATYHKLIGKVRKYRTMQEVIADALLLVDEPGKLSDEFPDMPKKPPTAFCLFVMKRSKKFPDIKGTKRMRVFASDWNELSEEKKESYRQKYLKLKKKYEEELEMFRHDHPEFPQSGANSTSRPNPPLPSKLFIESRIDKIKNKQPELSNAEAVKILMNKYKELPDEKKLKWIKRAMSRRQTYQDKVDDYLAHNPKSTTKPAVLHLSKEEERIWHSSKGKPLLPPPKNLFLFFCNTKRDTVHHLTISEQSRELSALYHKLTGEEEKDLKKSFKEEVEEYVRAYTHYYSSLPEEERADETPPEAALAVYNKILKDPPDQQKKKKKKKKTKSEKAGIDNANDKKAKLSDLPRPNGEYDSESAGSLPSPGTVVPAKRKAASLDPGTPQKKSKSVAPTQNDIIDDDASGTPQKNKHVPVTPTQNDVLDEDALLSMWTPKKDNEQNHPEFPLPGSNSTSRPNPPLPSQLFIESRIEKIKNKQPELSNAEAVKILMNKYEELPDKKKLKWIKRAMSRQQTYQEVEEDVQAYSHSFGSLPEEEWADEKAPEEALAVYNKITQEDQQKKKKKTKSEQAGADNANKKKVRLSDLLPRPNRESDSDSAGSLPPSGTVASTKRKAAPLDPATPRKKSKYVPVAPTQNNIFDEDASGMPQTKSKHVPVTPAQNDILDEDALLSMWTPKMDNDTLSPAEDITDTPKKSSKKAKKSKA